MQVYSSEKKGLALDIFYLCAHSGRPARYNAGERRKDESYISAADEGRHTTLHPHGEWLREWSLQVLG